MIEELKALLATEEGMKACENYWENIRKKDEIHENQLDRFHLKFKGKKKFTNIVEKIIKKYESKEYKDKWYKRGIEPPEDLYFFLLRYTEKYGKEGSKKDYEKYGTRFTSELYYIHGFYFNLMNGQGSFVEISKK